MFSTRTDARTESHTPQNLLCCVLTCFENRNIRAIIYDEEKWQGEPPFPHQGMDLWCSGSFERLREEIKAKVSTIRNVTWTNKTGTSRPVLNQRRATSNLWSAWTRPGGL